ncbi:MAG: general secretion pathway protein GspK [Candidatus Omnitrophica bacterium]|nr:general secretion pathway protein GspK [Candidatus Omnitrophota bacterium]
MAKNNSGVILITVLWVLAVLSLLALSLRKGASLELSLIRNNVAELKAYAASRAGINYVQQFLSQNKSEKDTLYQCGIKWTKDQDPQKYFKDVTVAKDTHFDIVALGSDYGKASKGDAYGIQDEQGKINLNAMDGSNFKVFSHLLQEFDIGAMDADAMAAAVVDWHSSTTTAFKSIDGAVGAKDDFYMNQSVAYKCKNKPFDRIEELLLVKGMNDGLFRKIKNFITVFPKNPQGGFKINFNTASDAVIHAVVKAMTVGLGADETAQALIRLRNGADNIPMTPDDGILDSSILSASQQLSVNALKASQGIDTSEYFQVSSVGVDESTGIRATITAMIHRPQGQGDLSIVAWHRD